MKADRRLVAQSIQQGVKMLQEAGSLHDQVTESITCGLILAIDAGNRLRAAKNLVPHGEFTQLLATNFCEPHGATIRTAQRYMLLAANRDKLIEAIRRKTGDRELSSSDQELLSTVSARQALEQIKRLTFDDGTRKTNKSIPSREDWIVTPTIAKAAKDFLGPQVVDVAGAPGFNPLDAIRVITPDMDALCPNIEWGSAVWVNPGLKKPLVTAFLRETVSRVNAGEVHEALLLLPATMSASWSREIICYPRAVFPQPFEIQRFPSQSAKLDISMMLVAICDTDRIDEFAHAFDRLCSLLVPFPYGETR